MAAKPKSVYVCNACSAESPRWAGQCSECKKWNTLQEQRAEPRSSGGTKENRQSAWAGAQGVVRDLKSIKPQELPRIPTGLGELDRVLGGGLVPGSVSLIGGGPGIGKSTLLLQVAAALGGLYVSGEESDNQIVLRAERLGLSEAPLRLVSEIDVTNILSTLESEKPKLAIIDSIQTMYHPELQSAAGSVAQIRECTALLTRYAKTSGCIIFLVGHVTKDDVIAGPKVLEHIVDAVLMFEGEHGTPYRMLRAVKNRFGAVNEMGVFAMGERGLEEVSNASSLFLTQHDHPVSGCAVFATMEGNRPMLVEIQALIEATPSPNPRRYAAGLDLNRLNILLAVLNKHAGIPALLQNVYLKVVGGVRLTEPATDLPALLSLYSSLSEQALPSGLISFGEVGLAGEIRPVQGIETRLKEAAKLGFTTAIVPDTKSGVRSIEGLRIHRITRVEQAVSLVSGEASKKAA